MEQNGHIERHGAETTELLPLAQGGAGTDWDSFAWVIAHMTKIESCFFNYKNSQCIIARFNYCIRSRSGVYRLWNMVLCFVGLLAGGFGCFVVAAQGLNGNFVIC